MANIVFLHPDLGVGGAERLALDAALALKEKGYNVSFVTSYHNESHCFEETKNGVIDVKVVGNWIPRNLWGRFYALFAYLKMIYCAIYIVLFVKCDLIFCDLVSVCIPILHLTVSRIIFYCHFPDQLLSKKEGFMKQIYRYPLDWLEEKTTGCADKIYVNSKFTKDVFKQTFKRLNAIPAILYPSINTSSFDKISSTEEENLSQLNIPKDKLVFASINRYERKKHVELAIESLINLKSKLPESDWANIILIVAGGYDNRVRENIEYFDELNNIVASHKLEEKVVFMKSLSDTEKVQLLHRCDCLIYTPPNEHFGIVPLEAMYCKKPVVACNSGGPTETIVNGETGFLCHFDVEDFSLALSKLVCQKSLRKNMGEKGYNRFIEKFSFAAFSNQLSSDVKALLESSKDK